MIFFKGLVYSALLGAMAVLGNAANASNNPAMDADVTRIDNEWARIKYQVHDKADQYRQMDALAGQAAQVSARYPGRVEPLLWQGIVTSEEAGMANMFQQLGYARAARTILNKAEAIDAKGGNGGVAMSLGVLYYRVPGFPIGFGSADKARAYLKTALAIDPNGLDSNYFYGDFLNSQGDRGGAVSYLQKALRAPVNPHRPVWEAGRRADVRAEIARIQKHSG
jgi:tetratricopeptide (TPR) repeat protein